MANNLIQLKRTSVSGRAANSVTLPNAGELALNMTDGILYSTNGSNIFEIGANNTNVNVSNTLTVVKISANGSTGTSGQVLASNGSATYWTTVGGSGTVTSVDSGNGLTGGPITGAGTLSVLANNGIVANSTGVFVNTAYIGTLSANNANNLGGVAATSYVNTSGAYTLSGNLTFNGNLIIGTTAGINANGGYGTAGQVLTSNGSTLYWSTVSGSSTAAVREQFTGDGSNTIFTVAGGYEANSLSVFINGVLMRNSVDVDVTNGSTVSFTVAPPNNALIDVVGSQAFTGVSPSFSDSIVASFLVGL